MTVALSALPQFFDNQGNPLSGGKLWTFSAGTLTPLASYTDRDGGTTNSNPVILDSAGRADIWLATNTPYRLRLENSGGTVLDTVDNFYAGADPAQLQAAGIVPATGGTYTGPVSFTGGATFDGTPAQDLETLDSLGAANVHVDNLWTNPDAAIWQRANATVSDGAIGLDRIGNLMESGSLTIGQVAQPIDGVYQAFSQSQPDATAKRFGAVQIVEAKNCVAYRGKKLCFAFRASASVNLTLRVALVAWTGTADGPTRDLVNNWASTNYTAGNFFVANTTTIAVTATAVPGTGAWTDLIVSSDSAGGVVAPSNMNNLYMMFWTDGQVPQGGLLYTSSFVCAAGAKRPIFSPPNAQVELAKCQRYYKTIGRGLQGIWVNQTIPRFKTELYPPMRTTPTTTVLTPNFSVEDWSAATYPTTTGSLNVINDVSDRFIDLNLQGWAPATATQYRQAYLRSDILSLSAELG